MIDDEIERAAEAYIDAAIEAAAEADLAAAIERQGKAWQERVVAFCNMARDQQSSAYAGACAEGDSLRERVRELERQNANLIEACKDIAERGAVRSVTRP